MEYRATITVNNSKQEDSPNVSRSKFSFAQQLLVYCFLISYVPYRRWTSSSGKFIKCTTQVCGDGLAHEGLYCGIGSCNIFGCRCKGGCFGDKGADAKANFHARMKKDSTDNASQSGYDARVRLLVQGLIRKYPQIKKKDLMSILAELSKNNV